MHSPLIRFVIPIKRKDVARRRRIKQALSLALASHPAIILADEPTGALDSKTADEIMRIFQQLNDEQHMTIVLVTHEPDIAVHAKRLVRFRDGEIQEDRPIKHREDELKLHAEMEVP